MIVTLSVICASSSRRCEIYTIPHPWLFSLRIILNSSSISRDVSADVGSSMIRIFALIESAFAISIICCFETGSSPTISSGLISTPSSPRYFLAISSILELFNTNPLRSSRPRNIFCATVRSLHIFSS